MMLTLIFLQTFVLLTAPANFRATIAMPEPVYVYNVSDPFLRSVIQFESNFQERAVNPYTGARGILQILPVMIREVNKHSDARYTWNDAFDPVKSVEMWWIIQDAKNPSYYPDLAIRLWFGTGKQYDGRTWHWYYNEVMSLYYEYV